MVSFLASSLTVLWCLSPLTRAIPIPTANELVSDQELAAFFDKENELQELDNERHLVLDDLAGVGERCGECQEGLECTRMNLLSRCVPKKCFEDEMGKLDLNMDDHQELIWKEAGVSKEEFLEGVREAGSATAFTETELFKRVADALLDNDGPLMAVQEAQKNCVGSKQTDIQYIGIHVEVGVGIDGVFQYIL